MLAEPLQNKDWLLVYCSITHISTIFWWNHFKIRIDFWYIVQAKTSAMLAEPLQNKNWFLVYCSIAHISTVLSFGGTISK
jgi:hypothetical protein